MEKYIHRVRSFEYHVYSSTKERINFLVVDNSLGLSWTSPSVSCSFENGIFLVGLLLTACFEHIFFANHTEQSRVRTKQLLFHDDVIIILFVLLGKLYVVKWNQNNMIYKLFSLLQNLIFFSGFQNFPVCHELLSVPCTFNPS